MAGLPRNCKRCTLFPKSSSNGSGGLYMILAKVLSISLCMGVGSLAFADDPPRPTSTPPAETAAAAPATADAASTVTADKAVADKAAADKAKSTDANAKTTAPSGITPDQAKTIRMAG